MKKAPKIRIKGFEGEWKECQIGHIAPLQRGFDLPTSNLIPGNYPVVYSNGIGFYHAKYKCQAPGLVTGRSGTIGKFTLIPEGYYWPHNTTLWVTDFMGNDPLFVDYLYQTIHFENYMMGSGVPTLNRNTIHNQHVFIPSSNEQRAIATYFRHIDSLIETADKKLASLKQVKEASLQSMFPKEGQKVPEVRFKGFEGEWKIDELGNLFTERVESDVFAEMLSVTLSQGIIKANENGRYDNSNNDKSKYRLVKVGDIAYNSMRMWQGASGYSPYYGIVSPAYTVVVPNNNVDSCFFAYMFKTAIMIKQFRLHSQGLTTDTWNLKFPAFSKIDVTYPADTAEQRKIASFFVHLDKQIAIAQQRLDLLRRIKSACLNEMFV
jgi:type I restriction enzyme S subunit